MKPLETILSILPTLSKPEVKKLKNEILLLEGTPCQRTGHKYKLTQQTNRMFLPPKQKFICTQCGEVKTI